MIDVLWILIVLIPVKGLVSGLDIDAIATFRSQEACQAVAEQIKAIHLRERDNDLVALCVPDVLE